MALGLSSPCSSRSGRPRPTSFLGIIALLSGLEWLRPFYNQPYEGGAGGGGGRAGSDVVGEANPVPTTTKTKVANKAVNRMKGLLGAMHSIADKLFMFTASVLPWLLSNSPAQNSSAPKATQNFEDPLMQVLIIGSLMLYQISFVTMFLASKFKDSESIDGVRFNIYIGLLLLVSIGFWSELCMILHNFAHISKYVMWPVGIFVSIFLVAFFFFEIYMEKQKILKELKEGCVPANGVLPERILNPRLPLPTV